MSVVAVMSPGDVGLPLVVGFGKPCRTTGFDITE
jgi:UDP-N-acetyl-D-mannosaminuronate dehydrogenase